MFNERQTDEHPVVHMLGGDRAVFGNFTVRYVLQVALNLLWWDEFLAGCRIIGHDL